jgi:hypothetical protein
MNAYFETWKSAIHEAGHIYFCWKYNIPYKGANYQSTETYDFESCKREDILRMKLAGHEAVGILTGNYNVIWQDIDYNYVIRELFNEETITKIRDLTRSELKDNWPLIEKIATVLSDKNYHFKDELNKLFEISA